MKKRKDYAVEDLISESHSALEQVGELEGLAGEFSEHVEERVKHDTRTKFVESEEYPVPLEIDGTVEVIVAEDDMQATANFYPPAEGRAALEVDHVRQALEEKGIRAGIDWDTIEKSVHGCNTERIELRSVTIATGTPATNEIPEHVVLEEGLLAERPALDSSALQVDYRQTSGFVLVREGQVLAERVHERPGVEGISVQGRIIPYRLVEVVPIEAGKNTRWEDDEAVASCDGRLEHDQRNFWVNKVLTVEEDVDYRTGHIDFPGDVIIEGQIKDGFKVSAGGGVYCSGTMDASEVVAEKDLVVGSGLIGRRKGKVKVGGNLRVKFIENCYAEAQGSVYVQVGILNSAVHSGDRIYLGDKGVIVGGTVYAQNGIAAAQIGTETGPKTEIYCGVDYLIEQKLEWIRDRNLELANKLVRVGERLKRSPNDAALTAVRTKMRDYVHKLNEAASSLMFKLDKNEDADIVVSGTVYPGTYLEICHISFIVNTVMRGTRFWLNKEKGNIVAGPLGAGRASRRRGR